MRPNCLSISSGIMASSSRSWTRRPSSISLLMQQRGEQQFVILEHGPRTYSGNWMSKMSRGHWVASDICWSVKGSIEYSRGSVGGRVQPAECWEDGGCWLLYKTITFNVQIVSAFFQLPATLALTNPLRLVDIFILVFSTLSLA